MPPKQKPAKQSNTARTTRATRAAANGDASAIPPATTPAIVAVSQGKRKYPAKKKTAPKSRKTNLPVTSVQEGVSKEAFADAITGLQQQMAEQMAQQMEQQQQMQQQMLTIASLASERVMSDDERPSGNDSSSSEDEHEEPLPKRKRIQEPKRKRAKSDKAPPPLAPLQQHQITSKCANVYNYYVDKKTTDAVHADKLVALVKLLPGYREPTYITMGEGGVLTTSNDTERKLEKQTMPLNQLLFALGKYRQLAGEAGNDAKADDIDRHMQNIINVSITHTDYVYFFYHTHVWQSFFANSVKVWGANFFELNDRALSAALFGAGPSGRPGRANLCDRCGTYTHSTDHCPFEAREEVGYQAQQRSSVTGGNQKNRWLGQANTSKGKNAPFKVTGMRDEFKVCNFFQGRLGCNNRKCIYKHVCRNCGGTNHGELGCKADQQK